MKIIEENKIMNKQNQFYEKNRRFVVTKSVKLFRTDELLLLEDEENGYWFCQ